MATTVQTRILDGVRVDCSGAPQGMVQMKFFDALKEFFARSNCWLFEMVISITNASNDYILSNGQPGTVINRLMWICRPQVPPPFPPVYLPMNPPQYLQLWSTNGPNGTQEAVNPLFGIPREAMLLNAGTPNPIMRIYCNPEANEYWIAVLALNVDDPLDKEGLASTVPDWIMDKYYDYIQAGVKSKMMLMPGKPWTSQQGSAFWGRKFNEGIGLARTEARARYVFSSQRWAFPQGWNARRPRVG